MASRDSEDSFNKKGILNTLKNAKVSKSEEPAETVSSGQKLFAYLAELANEVSPCMFILSDLMPCFFYFRRWLRFILSNLLFFSTRLSEMVGLYPFFVLDVIRSRDRLG